MEAHFYWEKEKEKLTTEFRNLINISNKDWTQRTIFDQCFSWKIQTLLLQYLNGLLGQVTITNNQYVSCCFFPLKRQCFLLFYEREKKGFTFARFCVAFTCSFKSIYISVMLLIIFQRSNRFVSNSQTIVFHFVAFCIILCYNNELDWFIASKFEIHFFYLHSCTLPSLTFSEGSG